MSKRLNRQNKAEILGAVIDQSIKHRTEELIAREMQIGMQVYVHAIKGHGAAIQSVPSGYYPSVIEIDVLTYTSPSALKRQTNGTRYHRVGYGHRWGYAMKNQPASFYHAENSMQLERSVRMPYDLTTGKVRLLATSPLGQELVALRAAWDKLKSDGEVLHTATNSALNSCATIKTLIKNYPELAQFCPDDPGTKLTVPPGLIAELMECTEKDTCTKGKKKKRLKKSAVIHL